MSYHKILLFLFIGLLYQCKTINSTSNTTSTMDIYLCIGQSNMAGRAPIQEQDKAILNNVFLFKGSEDISWKKATQPFNQYSTIRKKIGMQKLSPVYEFAKTMITVNPKQKIGLVVNAKGGTSIEEWEPGGLLYNQAINQTKKALQTGGVLKGILWHQGETNASRHKKYMPKIIALISALRKDFNLPYLPFVAGQLSEDKPKRKHFNEMIISLPNKVNNTKVVTSENTSTIDSTHFDSESQRILGERYAQKMFELIHQKQ